MAYKTDLLFTMMLEGSPEGGLVSSQAPMRFKTFSHALQTFKAHILQLSHHIPLQSGLHSFLMFANRESWLNMLNTFFASSALFMENLSAALLEYLQH